MTTILVTIHIVVCFFLIVIVLLQHGKGADMGAAFGGSSQTLFGTEGPIPLLNKVTTISAIVFMITSVALAYISSNSGGSSVMTGGQAPVATEQELPKAPETIPLPPSQPTEGSDNAPAEFPGQKSQ